MILAIYGAGGLGREILEMVRQLPAGNGQWDTVCFVEDIGLGTKKTVNHMPVYDFEDFIAKFTPAGSRFVIAVGEPTARAALFQKIKSRGFCLATLVHPNVHIPDSTTLAEGVVIQVNSFISCNVKIGKNSCIQTMAMIAHDVQVGSHSVISQHANIAGNCVIGSRTYLGMNASVREKRTVGDDSIIGMGSIVLRDIPDNVIAFGNPAKPVKKKDGAKVFH